MELTNSYLTPKQAAELTAFFKKAVEQFGLQAGVSTGVEVELRLRPITKRSAAKRTKKTVKQEAARTSSTTKRSEQTKKRGKASVKQRKARSKQSQPRSIKS